MHSEIRNSSLPWPTQMQMAVYIGTTRDGVAKKKKKKNSADSIRLVMYLRSAQREPLTLKKALSNTGRKRGAMLGRMAGKNSDEVTRCILYIHPRHSQKVHQFWQKF
jgi:hypothetical protein